MATSGSSIDMPIVINDNGTWRYPKAININDGGTWRTVKRVQINDNGTWRTPVLYVGEMNVGNNGNNYGFDQGAGFGSRSPANDATGYPIVQIIYNVPGDITDVTYQHSPGAFVGFTQTNYLKRVTIAGTTVNTADCSAFFNIASNSTLIFRWSGDVFSFNGGSGFKTVQFTAA